MKLTETQKSVMTKKDLVMLSTAKDNQPRTVFMCPSRIEDDRMIFSDVYMHTAKEHILSNEKVFIVGFNDNFKHWLKIEGIAKYQDSGALFEEIKDFEIHRGYQLKGIIVVEYTNIQEVVETH